MSIKFVSFGRMTPMFVRLILSVKI